MAGKFVKGLETEEDRQNERFVLDHLKQTYNITYKQMELLCRYDAELYDSSGKLIAITEIKCRKGINHDSYPTAIIRTDKWNACKVIAKQLSTKFIILYKYADGIFYLDETNTLSNQDGRWISKIKPYNNPFGEAEEIINFPSRLLKPMKK